MNARVRKLAVKARRYARRSFRAAELTAGFILIIAYCNLVVSGGKTIKQFVSVKTAEAMEVVAPAFGFEKPMPNVLALDIFGLAERQALRRTLSPSLLRALLKIESDYCKNNLSPAGAIGCGQIMPANARRVGKTVEQLKDPVHNIEGTAQILDEDIRYQGGSVRKGLQQYNGGPRCVAVIEACGNDVECMGYKGPKEKGCAESYYFADNVLNEQSRDIRS